MGAAVMGAAEEVLTYDDLKSRAHELAVNDPRTYEEIAHELDVSKSAVAQAVTTPGKKFSKVQIRIVELLSDHEVEVEEAFILRAKR